MFNLFHAITIKIAAGFMAVALFFGAPPTSSTAIQETKQDVASSSEIIHQQNVIPPNTKSQSSVSKPKTQQIPVTTQPVVSAPQPTSQTLKVAQCQAKAQTAKDNDLSVGQSAIENAIQSNPLGQERSLLLEYIKNGTLTSSEISQLPADVQTLITEDVPKYGTGVIFTQLGIVNQQIAQQSASIKENAGSKISALAQQDYDKTYSDCLSQQ